MVPTTRRLISWFAIVAVVASIDQLLKLWARATLAQGSSTGLLPGIVELTLVYNPGAAFGIGAGGAAAFAVFSVVFIAILCWVSQTQVKGRTLPVVLALIAGGGVGNLIDRLATGYVTDYLHFMFMRFPVFNLADICITCGCAAALVLWLVQERACRVGGGGSGDGEGEVPSR